jgi:hypothetical protein
LSGLPHEGRGADYADQDGWRLWALRPLELLDTREGVDRVLTLLWQARNCAAMESGDVAQVVAAVVADFQKAANMNCFVHGGKPRILAVHAIPLFQSR